MGGGEKKINDLLNELEGQIKSSLELDYFLTHRDRYFFILQKILSLNLKPRSKILDIGCYPPHLFKILEKLGFKLWGISSKHEPVRHEKIVCLNLEQDKLPFKKEYFDLILMAELMEHLTLSPKVYLGKIKKILKPKGMILVTTPNAAHLKNRVKMILGRTVSYPLSELWQTKEGDDSIYYRHNREFTKDELEEIFIQTGFKIKKLEFFIAYGPLRKRLKTQPVFSRIVKFAGFLLTLFCPPWRDSLYLEVEK